MKYQFYYGTEDFEIEISHIVYRRSVNNLIYIPSGDEERAILFTDPVPGFVKSIFIKIDGKRHTYKSITSIYIDGNTIYTVDDIPDKFLSTFKDNLNHTQLEQKLNKIQSSLTLHYGEFYEEYPEQLMSVKYIKGDEKILELGANIGRNTLIMSRLLKDSSNIVSLECDPESAYKLEINKISNSLKFNIEIAALSKRPLIQKEWNTIVSETVLDGYTKINTVTYQDLVKKWNTTFDTLVIDCEGAFYYILMDFPEILNNVNLIIMENDYTIEEHYKYINQKLKDNEFYVDYTKPGGWGPCRNNFYEVWKK